MAWLFLFLAGPFEVGWAVGLKYTEGFTRPFPAVLAVAAMVVSVVILGFALRSIPLGAGYAIWTGIGTVGTVVFGVIYLAEPATAARIFCVVLMLAGITGLTLISNT